MSGRNAIINDGDIQIAPPPKSLEPNLPGLGCLFGLGKAVQIAFEHQSQVTTRHIENSDFVVGELTQITSLQFPVDYQAKSSVGIISFKSKKHSSSQILAKLKDNGITLGKCRPASIFPQENDFYLRVSSAPETQFNELESFVEILARIEQEEL